MSAMDPGALRLSAVHRRAAWMFCCVFMGILACIAFVPVDGECAGNSQDPLKLNCRELAEALSVPGDEGFLEAVVLEYRGKAVNWTGTVLGVEETLWGKEVSVSCGSEDKPLMIRVLFDDSWKTRIAQLSIGQKIRFKGELDGFDKKTGFSIRNGALDSSREESPVAAPTDKGRPSQPTGPAVAPTGSPVPSQDAERASGNWTDPTTGIPFAWVRSGCFDMGCETHSRECDNDESPRHQVCVDRFWMGKTEVTVGQFRRFADATGYRSSAERAGWAWAFNQKTRAWEKQNGLSWRNPGFDQGNEHPVVNVSWHDGVAMAQWMSSRGNGRFRLPSEAQWEYACRGGTAGVRFWGDSPENACRFANVADVVAAKRIPGLAGLSCSDGFVWTAPVANFDPNPFGLHDMLGNVWEWCEDVYHQEGYSRHEAKNALYTGPGPGRVFRGASWSSQPRDVRSANRYYSPPEGPYNNLGFRLIREP